MVIDLKGDFDRVVIILPNKLYDNENMRSIYQLNNPDARIVRHEINHIPWGVLER